jgi:hypothetical protein
MNEKLPEPENYTKEELRGLHKALTTLKKLKSQRVYLQTWDGLPHKLRFEYNYTNWKE